MGELHGEEKLPENIYMIGDNPASDIIGGNTYGWNTCLVRTGVFQGGDNDENNPANFGVFPNVLEAVKKALRNELGQDFKCFFDEKINPVLHGDATDAAAILYLALFATEDHSSTKREVGYPPRLSGPGDPTSYILGDSKTSIRPCPILTLTACISAGTDSSQAQDGTSIPKSDADLLVYPINMR
ncbi:hypothetical protein NM208_g5095 [Fusarium decemcellulare]|uniref:Uncharacterized protein n=1 Tax=Fusarium decemcellulare TaxID=57161 RepID=A0ACC1SIF7_9HYPO|nr:hypothetical protein NM208_g5095 [Fusarium decemcellulare]